MEQISYLKAGGAYMALKDVLKSLTGKKQDEVSRKNDAANALMASDQFPIIQASDMDMSKYKQIPLMGLATLGAAFMQLPEAARTITSTVTKSVDMQGKLFWGWNPKAVSGFMRDYRNFNIQLILFNSSIKPAAV